MLRKVIDSSVAVKWVSADGELHLQQADVLLNEVQEAKTELYCPELSKYEIGNALWKKSLKAPEAAGSLATYYSLPITFVPETRERAERTLALSNQLKMTYYDASFISLAEELDKILITDNAKHQGRAKTIKVIPLEKYK